MEALERGAGPPTDREGEEMLPEAGYDSHLSIEELCREETNLQRVPLIPKTLESYSALITPKYRILDSIQHLTFSLDKLVDNLTNGGTSDEHLHVLKEHVEVWTEQ